MKTTSLYIYACKIYNNKSNSSAKLNELEIAPNESIEDMQATDLQFEILMRKSEFDQLCEFKYYKLSGLRKNSNKLWRRLKQGVWEEVISDKIYSSQKLSCGFLFKNHYVSLSEDKGYIKGKCNCGSKLDIDISSNDTKNVILTCKISMGTLKKCSKRFLRQPLRAQVAKKLRNKPTEVYRTQQANQLMEYGDKEPPTLYSSDVLYAAKSEHIRTEYLDPDPIMALLKMKCGSYFNDIHHYCITPFTVYYWSNYQIHQLQKLCSKQVVTFNIDASGGFVHRIALQFNQQTGNIFLYLLVVNVNGNQFSVAQMLTDSHTTDSIQSWLMKLRSEGAPDPKEVVTDASRALMNAVVRQYAFCQDVEDYSDKLCNPENLPQCYVRIDVAHFLNIYVRVLKNVKMQRVKRFYLASIGQLIMSRSDENAHSIFEWILAMSNSEHDGHLVNGQPTLCEIAREKLTRIISCIDEEEKLFYDDLLEATDDNESLSHCPAIDDLGSNLNSSSSWHRWGLDIESTVLNTIECEKKSEPDRVNPYYLPQLSQRLMKHVKLLPMWSNIRTDNFGFGRVPASSASVESEFNKLKHLVFPKRNIRPDVFVQNHVDYLSGKLKLVNANLDNANESHVMDETSEVVDAENGVSNLLLQPSNAEASNQETCPACANGDLPSGAHICYICKKAVHTLDECSLSYDSEEGYGMRRICKICSNAQSIRAIIASREVENWKGLAKNDVRKNLYLGASKAIIKDSFDWSRHKKLPVLKNANHMSIHEFCVDDEIISVSNTCAFDSIFQILFVAAVDNASFGEKIRNFDKDLIFKMVLNALDHGITPQIYKFRTQVLLKYSKKTQLENTNTYKLDCSKDVAFLYTKLFEDHPTVLETTTCTKDCRKDKSIAKITVEFSALYDEDFSGVIRDKMILDDSVPCGTKNCIGTQRTELSRIGTIVAVEPLRSNGGYETIRLRDIPKSVTHPLNPDKDFKLLGLISYRGPTNIVRKTKGIAHYLAIVLRQTTWYEFDDLTTTTKARKETCKISPELLLYYNNDD